MLYLNDSSTTNTSRPVRRYYHDQEKEKGKMSKIHALIIHMKNVHSKCILKQKYV